jgi:hypothetical protein
VNLDYQRILKAIEAAVPDPKAQQEGYRLLEGYAKRYFKTDSNMTPLFIEPEVAYWMDADTLICGKVDLVGLDETGDTFFGEWKTASIRKERTDWRREWVLSTQALTYGLLLRYGKIQGVEQEATIAPLAKFHVRLMFKTTPLFKTTPPKTDFEWFTYKDEEIAWWHGQVKAIADEIRGLRQSGHAPWFPNFNECARYGDKYLCTYFQKCSTRQFTNTSGWLYGQYETHLDVERRLNEAPGHITNPNLVVLDATRMDTYLRCREKYRNTYEEHLAYPVGEALMSGSAFHAGAADYWTQIKEQRP